MAETVGVDFIYSYDGNDIGGKEDATATFSRDVSELAPTQGTGTSFRRRLTGLKDVQIDFDALYLENVTAVSGFSPTVTVDPNGTPVGLQYISEVTITLNRNLIEFANSQNSEYLARAGAVVDAEAEITVDTDVGQIYSSSSAGKLLIDAWDSTAGTEEVEIALPGGNTSFTSDWVVESFEDTSPAEDAKEMTFSLSSTGAITETLATDLDSGLDGIITTVFATDPSSAEVKGTTSTTGNFEFFGPALPSSVEITIPVEGSEDGVTTSGTLEAAGAFTIQETA